VAIVGEAFVVVKAITTGFGNQIQQSLNGLNSAGSQAGQSIGNAFSSGATSGLSKADQAAMDTYKTLNKLIEGGYYTQMAAVAAANGIAVLASGLFALGSQLAAATPALIVLPSILSAIAQGGIAAKIAFGGIGEAISGLNKKKSGAGTIDRMPDLLEAIGRAEERERLARAKLVKVTLAIDQARLDAAESAEQLKFASEDAALGEKRAAINLEKARKTLARVQDLPPNSTARKEAELAYQEAELGYRKAKDSNADLKTAVAKNVKEGIEGSKEVTAAKDAIADADREVKHAVDAVTKAERDKANYLKQQAGSDPLAGLGKSAREFAKYIANLKPLIDELKVGIQDTLFPKLQTAIDTLLKSGLFDILKTKLADTGTAIGNAAIDFAKLFSNPTNLKNFSDVLDTNNITIGKMGTVTGNLATSFITLLDAASPLINRFTDWLVVITNSWQKTLDAKNATGDLTDTFNDAGDIAAQFFDIIGNIFGALMNMGKAASGPGSGGQMIFDFLEEATAKFKAFTGGALKDGSLEEFFKGASDSFITLLEIIGIVVGAILKTADDPGVGKFFDSLKSAAQSLADALTGLSESGVIEYFGRFIELIAKAIEVTTESGSVKTYFGILNTGLGFLVAILSNPAFQALFGILATVHASRLAFGRMGKVVMGVGKYFKGSYLGIVSNVGKFMKGNFVTGFKNAYKVTGSLTTALKSGITQTKIYMKVQKIWWDIQKYGKIAFNGVKGALTKMGTAIKKSTIYTKLSAAATKAWAAVQKILNIQLMGNPLGLWILAIAAVIAIVVVMYRRFGWFRDFVNTVWDGIKAVIEGVFNWLRDNWKLVLIILTGPFGLAIALIVTYWDEIKNAIAWVWANVIEPIFRAFGTVFELVWAGIQLYFETVWGLIHAAITFVWNNIIQPVFRAFQTVFELVWAGIQLYFQTVWAIIHGAITFGWNNIIRPVFDAIGRVFGTIWSGIQTAFTNAWGFITRTIDGAQRVFGRIGDAIRDTFRAAINFIIRAWNGIEFTFPGVKLRGLPDIPGFTLGLPDIPLLAEGGIVNPTPGGTLALIGEAGRSERIEPLDSQGLSKRDKAIITMLSGGQSGGGGINITVNPSPGMDEVELAALVSRQISFQLRRGAA
jgi:phage-related protein